MEYSSKKKKTQKVGLENSNRKGEKKNTKFYYKLISCNDFNLHNSIKKHILQ